MDRRPARGGGGALGLLSRAQGGTGRAVLRGMAAAFLVLALLVGVTADWSGGPREVARRMLAFVIDPVLLSRVETLRDPIVAAADEQGLDPNLIAAIVAAESSGRVDAVSHAGALGLMQLMPASAGDAARKLGLPEPTREQLLTDGPLNLRLGAQHFAWTLRHEENDVERALVAYNAGRGRLGQWIREAGSYTAWRAEREAAGDSQVLAYARKVLAYTESFRERGAFAAAVDVDAGKSARRAPSPERTDRRAAHDVPSDR